VYYSDQMLSNDLMRKLPANVTVHEIANRTCKKLFANDRISRVFAIAYTPLPLDLQSLGLDPRDIVALEDLTISGNIGSIIRTSVALGAGGIVLLNADPVDIYDRRIIRASRGYIFSLPVVTATTAELIEFCRRNGLPILVMAVRAGDLLDKVASLSKRLVIIFGSEKDGCSQALMDAATLQVRIPTNPRVESLNVSTAAGIMLYNRNWFNNSYIRK
jgi:tRNA G18 (ribose-2'-O)-methylase SpoU